MLIPLELTIWILAGVSIGLGGWLTLRECRRRLGLDSDRLRLQSRAELAHDLTVLRGVGDEEVETLRRCMTEHERACLTIRDTCTTSLGEVGATHAEFLRTIGQELSEAQGRMERTHQTQTRALEETAEALRTNLHQTAMTGLTRALEAGAALLQDADHIRRTWNSMLTEEFTRAHTVGQEALRVVGDQAMTRLTEVATALERTWMGVERELTGVVALRVAQKLLEGSPVAQGATFEHPITVPLQCSCCTREIGPGSARGHNGELLCLACVVEATVKA